MIESPTATPPRAESFLAVLLVAIAYLWVFPYHAAVNNPNENVRIYMTVAIVDDGTFATNRVENTWGYVNDKSLRETPLSEAIRGRHIRDEVLRVAGIPDDVLLRFRTGHPTREDLALRAPLLYSSKAPGSSYLGVPAYWLLTRLTHQDSRPIVAPPAPSPEAPAAEAPPVAPMAPGEPGAFVLPSVVTPDLAVPGAPKPPSVRARRRASLAPPPPREPIDRTLVVYAVRLFANVLPGIIFAWFWHRFLAARSRSRTLRDAVFFSTTLGSSLFAYSEVYASHAQNAWCFAAALMAMTTVRERDVDALAAGRAPGTHAGQMFLAGLFGAGATLFEYPAGVTTGVIALWIVAANAERRRGLLALAAVALAAGGYAFKKHHNAKAAVAAVAVAAICYALTLRGRNVARLAAAGLGGAIPIGLLMLYHKRCFGDAFKPGYSYLENPQFRTEIAQGFFGATSFSWDAGLRLWFDPSFGLIPCTFVFVAAFIGLGAMLSWSPSGLVLPRRSPINLAWSTVARLALAATFGYAAFKLAGAFKAHPTALSHPDIGHWVIAALMGLIGYLSVTLPAPVRRDRAMGAAILMSFFGLTFLIGMMNNWRGGWQVGPRYLVTLVPALGIASLAGLDSLHTAFSRAPIGQRVVTAFAAGATLTAFLVTGLPSATFPHLPTEYTSPFFEMVIPLLRDGFVPHNAGHLLGRVGLASMGVFFFAAALMAATVLRGDERRPLRSLAHALTSIALSLLLLIPFAASARTESSSVTRYVKSAFEPRPPDAPAAAVPERETVAQATARARRHTEAGEQGPALEAWLRAIRATPPTR